MVKANRPAIPEDIRQQADKIVADFNSVVLSNPNCQYVTRYSGKFLYLDRQERGTVSHICRLKYAGKMNDWGFAIYKYSSERYDEEDWLIPGFEHINGTIEGALKAGLKAYPPGHYVNGSQLLKGFIARFIGRR